MRVCLLLLFAAYAIHAQEYVKLVQDGNGVWWFSHNGTKFFSRGVNHVNNGGMDDGVGGRESSECRYPLCGDTLSFSHTLLYAPYYNSTIERYGSEQAWALNTAKRLLTWNFNSLGGWSSKLMEKQGLYYAHLLDIGTTWLRSDWLPDLFDPAFEAQCFEIARKECLPRAKDPFLIGYQTDNEVNWDGLHMLRTYLQFNNSAPGLEGAIDFLTSKYHTLENLNKAWNINASSWTNVGAFMYDARLNTTVFYADQHDFVYVCATRYFNISTTAIKKYDPNHLLLSARFYDLPVEVLRAALPYVDMIDLHMYLAAPDLVYLQQIHDFSKKPIWIGEFSFTAVDSNMPNAHGAWANNPLTTQSQRAKHFDNYVRTLANLPYVVGYHWWQWADEPSSGRWPDNEDSNYGIVHIDDDEYQLLTQQMTATNAQLEKLHAVAHKFKLN